MDEYEDYEVLQVIPTKRNMEHIMESTQEPMHRMLLGIATM